MKKLKNETFYKLYRYGQNVSDNSDYEKVNMVVVTTVNNPPIIYLK